MPSHHHHCCCCCCSRSNNNSCCSDSSPNPSTTSDQLLQLLSAHLLLQQPQIKPHHHLRPLKSPIHHPQKQQHHQQQQPSYEDPTRSLLNSLRRRIDALESSIPTPPPPPPPHPLLSLRDLAARTIQSAFRRHLLRRSQTLRHLNRLALLKSRAAALKSSLSAHPDPKALSHKALDLLLDLDAIQSADPMIREGKRAISRELARMLEFVDKVLPGEQREQREHQMESTGHGSRPARRVSFEESREVNGDEPDSRGFEVEDGEVDYLLGEGEESLKRFADPEFSNAMRELFNGELGKLGLSAPLPVKMETRRGWDPF